MRIMMSGEKQIVWVIERKGGGNYFSDYICGCVVWKNHISRAAIYTNKEVVLSIIDLYELDAVPIKRYAWW